VADALQPLALAPAAHLDRVTADDTDAAACACSDGTAGRLSDTPSAARENTYGSDISHMHTLRVFVISRAFADGFDLAANACRSSGPAHADPAPSTFLASSSVSMPNSDYLAPDSDASHALAPDPSPAPAPASLSAASALPIPPLSSKSEFRSAGFLKRVCDGLMHTLQPLTQLLVEIIPLSLPADVMDARCFVRQVPFKMSRCAVAKRCVFVR
jgi:hypothetical protein